MRWAGGDLLGGGGLWEAGSQETPCPVGALRWPVGPEPGIRSLTRGFDPPQSRVLPVLSKYRMVLRRHITVVRVETVACVAWQIPGAGTGWGSWASGQGGASRVWLESH